MDKFRLLSRFGTRLGARHGEGTKRHIKFDDYSGSLFANIKLPGDTTWTKVTPDASWDDLEASMRKESLHNQKRMAAKLVLGPRERLGRPLPLATSAPSPVCPIIRGQSSGSRVEKGLGGPSRTLMTAPANYRTGGRAEEM